MISDAIVVSLNRKHALFRQYIRMAMIIIILIIILIIIILLKTIPQLLYVMLEIIISRENSLSARIIRGTPGRL